MKKILLTGSTGFVGSALLRSLSKKYKVYVFLRKKNQKVLKNKNIIKIDYINLNDLNKKIINIKKGIINVRYRIFGLSNRFII